MAKLIWEREKYNRKRKNCDKREHIEYKKLKTKREMMSRREVTERSHGALKSL